MPNKLSDIDVQFISLVKKGANGKTILWKSDEADMDAPEFRQFPIAKINEDKRMVYGIVYSPGEVDSQDDTATADEIEKAAHNFLKQKRIDKVDADHDYDPDEGFVAESWLTKADDPMFPDDPEGSWAVGIKIEDDETWELVKSGEYSGLSMAGSANREPVEKSIWGRIKDVFNLKKDFNSEYNSEQVYDAWDAFWSAQWDVLFDSEEMTGEERRTALETNFNQFLEALENDTMVLKSDENKEETMKTEEVQKVVDERLEEKLQPIQESLEKLEKAQSDDGADDAGDNQPDGDQEFTKADFASLKERIETLEKGTKGSDQGDGQDGEVKKSKGINFVPA